MGRHRVVILADETKVELSEAMVTGILAIAAGDITSPKQGTVTALVARELITGARELTRQGMRVVGALDVLEDAPTMDIPADTDANANILADLTDEELNALADMYEGRSVIMDFIPAEMWDVLESKGFLRGRYLTDKGTAGADLAFWARFNAQEHETMVRLGVAQYYAEKHYTVATDPADFISAGDSPYYRHSLALMINAIMDQYPVTQDQAWTVYDNMNNGDWNVSMAHAVMLADQWQDGLDGVETLFATCVDSRAAADSAAYDRFALACGGMYGLTPDAVRQVAKVAAERDMMIYTAVDYVAAQARRDVAQAALTEWMESEYTYTEHLRTAYLDAMWDAYGLDTDEAHAVAEIAYGRDLTLSDAHDVYCGRHFTPTPRGAAPQPSRAQEVTATVSRVRAHAAAFLATPEPHEVIRARYVDTVTPKSAKRRLPRK